MKVLLSIKPTHVEKIFSGEKKFEFRRSLFKNSSVKNAIIYASAPIKKVVGEFEIDEVLSERLNSLWETTKAQSGITEEFFYKYFKNKAIGNAIKIGQITKYDIPRSLADYNINHAPQSFCYVSKGG